MGLFCAWLDKALLELECELHMQPLDSFIPETRNILFALFLE